MKNAEGFKFMKNLDDRHNNNNHYNKNSKYSSNKNHGSGNYHNNQNKQQQWGNIGAGAGNEGGLAYRKKSGAANQDKPFSHLGAAYQGDDKHRVYRNKAPSHI